LKRLRTELNYANLMVTILAFVVLAGGTAFAATQLLPKNSVGSKQLKKGAVTPTKLSKAAKSALTGARGSAGATGAPGPKGDRGERGEQGEPGPLIQTLPSGKTERGDYGFAGTRAMTGFSPAIAVSYPIPLSFQPSLNIVKTTGPPTASCPGSVQMPSAVAGSLCVYEEREDVNISIENVPAEGHFGFLLLSGASPGENFEVHGTWAVTAP
jgi:hypothetical protein